MPIIVSEEQFRSLFSKYPQVRKATTGDPVCPYCDNPLSPKALEAYELSTEYGTPFCDIRIECDVCGRTIWQGMSWHAGIDDADDVVVATADMLEDTL